MRKYHARLLVAGLGAIVMPACLAPPVRWVPDSAGESIPHATVRRVCPEPVPVQQSSVQQVMVQQLNLPPIQGPNGEWLMPVQIVSVPSATAPPASSPTPADDNVELVTVSHSAEPPLAPPLPPSTKPTTSSSMVVKLAPESLPLPSPAPTVSPKPLPQVAKDAAPLVPPGAQVLILQPTKEKGTEVQTAGHTSSEPLSNVLAPTMAEELKLVSPAKPTETLGSLVAALKAYQDKSPTDAGRQLSHLDPVNQELLRKLLPLAVRLGDAGAQKADPAEVADVVEQLQQMLTTLRAKAALRIDKLCYCRPPAKPVRLGSYQPLADDHAFHAGETVEVYMELRNFSCEAKDSEYATHLTTVLEVTDERGEVVNRFEFERDRPETATAPKQDYFHICRFPVQGIAPGQYTLTARVTDMPTGKTAKRTLPLAIEAARRTARGTAD